MLNFIDEPLSFAVYVLSSPFDDFVVMLTLMLFMTNDFIPVSP